MAFPESTFYPRRRVKHNLPPLARRVLCLTRALLYGPNPAENYAIQIITGDCRKPCCTDCEQLRNRNKPIQFRKIRYFTNHFYISLKWRPWQKPKHPIEKLCYNFHLLLPSYDPIKFLVIAISPMIKAIVSNIRQIFATGSNGERSTTITSSIPNIFD